VAIVFDLDGVIWLAGTSIPGSAQGVARLRAAGQRVLFVTNNSSATVDEVEGMLEGMGIPAKDDVVTSSQAAASLVAAGERVHVVGGPGVREALEARGAVLTSDGEPAAALVLGRSTAFDFAMMAAAASTVRAGARFIATNDDATYPTPHGLEPGNGALVAAVETASGVRPVVAGKPYSAMADLVRSLLPAGEQVVMVGDRADTDGRFGVALGGRFALVLSGVTRRIDLPVSPAPDLVADDVAALVGPLLALLTGAQGEPG
jgi:HAD superfamily hydrolase (TIGR01450 family)